MAIAIIKNEDEYAVRLEKGKAKKTRFYYHFRSQTDVETTYIERENFELIETSEIESKKIRINNVLCPWGTELNTTIKIYI